MHYLNNEVIFISSIFALASNQSTHASTEHQEEEGPSIRGVRLTRLAHHLCLHYTLLFLLWHTCGVCWSLIHKCSFHCFYVKLTYPLECGMLVSNGKWSKLKEDMTPRRLNERTCMVCFCSLLWASLLHFHSWPLPLIHPVSHPSI